MISLSWNRSYFLWSRKHLSCFYFEIVLICKRLLSLESGFTFCSNQTMPRTWSRLYQSLMYSFSLFPKLHWCADSEYYVWDVDQSFLFLLFFLKWVLDLWLEICVVIMNNEYYVWALVVLVTNVAMSNESEGIENVWDWD